MSLIIKEIERGELSNEPIAIQFDDYTSVANATIETYKNGTGTDATSTYFPSGSISYSGNIVTTKPLTALVGGNYYMISIAVEVNGTSQKQHRYLRVNCVDRKSGFVRRR